MRIGINTMFLVPGEVGGTETYLRGLLYGLSKVGQDDEYVILTNTANHDTFDFDASNFSRYACRCSGRSRFRRIFYEQTGLCRVVRKLKIDVLHSPAYVYPLKAPCANVVTIHDMQYCYYPQNFPKARLLYWKYFVPLSAKGSDIVVTVSNNSKKDIVELLKTPAEKVIVTYESSKFAGNFGVRETDERVLNKNGIGPSYILSVGSLLPGKNLDNLIRAFSLIMDKTEHQLVLAGMNGHAIESVRNALSEKKMGRDRVVLLGRVSDELLYCLYRKAALFVLPSLFEGFGIPLVEAMSLGCPVAASNRTSIPEVVGDAAVLFEPESPERIAEAMISVLSDQPLRARLIQRGLGISRQFSWEKMARETICAYYRAYENFHRGA